ncbi:hypothetical protein [Azospirillum himalayense]|uniref:Uncharacterized protein n=1 Tax=Azospirillum himalayense TaxID=654847 RepID=A0ABW0G4R5_9PROT
MIIRDAALLACVQQGGSCRLKRELGFTDLYQKIGMSSEQIVCLRAVNQISS